MNKQELDGLAFYARADILRRAVHGDHPGHTTLMQFCRAAGISPNWARKMGAVANVWDVLSEAGITGIPESETALKHLIKLDPELMVEAYRIAERSGVVTAKALENAVKFGVLKMLTREDIGDPLFPSDNRNDIPALRLDRMATALEPPLYMYGTTARADRVFGTVGFYVDDYRFRDLYNDPTPVINAGVSGAVEPNFSVYEGTLFPHALFAIYMKRWIARLWQNYDIPIWVDLNVAPRYYGLNLSGVPRGWLSYATRGYSDRPQQVANEYELAKAHAGVYAHADSNLDASRSSMFLGIRRGADGGLILAAGLEGSWYSSTAHDQKDLIARI